LTVLTTVLYLGHEESLREEHDLTDLLHVGHDDDDWSEQRLDRLRELGAPGVARVHCDEDSNTLIHHDLLTLKLYTQARSPAVDLFP